MMGEETPRASFIPAQGNALGSSHQAPFSALKGRLIVRLASRPPATRRQRPQRGRLGSHIPAQGGQIGLQARSDGRVKPGAAILRCPNQSQTL